VRTRDNVRVEVRVSASVTVYSAIFSTYGKFHIIYRKCYCQYVHTDKSAHCQYTNRGSGPT